MTRAIAVATFVSLASLAGPCATHGADDTNTSAPSDPAPPPVPITSATTPPVWHAPEPPAPPSSALAALTEDPPSPDLVKARAAADAKDWKKVRALLEKKARAGKASPEEAQLALDACNATKDRACADAIKAKSPDVAPSPANR